jgi:hypothetical protein
MSPVLYSRSALATTRITGSVMIMTQISMTSGSVMIETYKMGVGSRFGKQRFVDYGPE